MRAWLEIASFQNLCRAARRAAHGKRKTRSVASFLERLEPETLRLQDELEHDAWRPSRPATFTIHDPKLRQISAAPFRDRVVHHALVDPLEPLFEAALVPETFACRRGKGTRAALIHAQELVARFPWFLKLDVAKCFESIDHAVVAEVLRGLGLEARVERLCLRILHGVEGRAAVGLPIGNLTSQWFANLVLGKLDRFALALPGVEGYARYMDDFVLSGRFKSELRAANAAVARFLQDDLRLGLKQRATILAPSSQGLPFLGWRVHPGVLRVRRESLRHLRRRVRHRRWELRTGRIDSERWIATLRAVSAHLAQGDTLALRRSWLGPLVHEQGSGFPTPRTA